nr:SCO2322 family protein [Streptomyces sp. SID5468]
MATAALPVLAAPAHAAGYRYWSFWERDHATWRFAQSGPATTTPKDGAVEGWRFAVTADSASAAKPRGPADFDTICAGTAAKDGMKRVALVLDFGVPEDAPAGDTPPQEHTACARLPVDGTAAEAVATVAKPLRYNSAGMLCAIAGYPQTGCGEQVSSPAPAHPTASAAPPRPGGSGGPSAGLLAGIAVVVVVGGAAVWQARRRRP